MDRRGEMRSSIDMGVRGRLSQSGSNNTKGMRSSFDGNNINNNNVMTDEQQWRCIKDGTQNYMDR